jgi:ferrous iron transport protein B
LTNTLTIALAGNANVGKSVLFNHLTGLHQHIGNWPGKTIARAEGTLHFRGYTIDVIDLPGIYSLSTFSLEESISREYISSEKPDLVINVIDASILERNLFFTLQLLELETPMILALNQIDMAESKGVHIDYAQLETQLGIPVVPVIAIKGIGIYELIDAAIQLIEDDAHIPPMLPYGEEVENCIQQIITELDASHLTYPPRYTAIKLLEQDEEIQTQVSIVSPSLTPRITQYVAEIEKLHGHSCSTVITSERYELAGCIARDVQTIIPTRHPLLRERLHSITTHPIAGYPILIGIMIVIFLTIFTLGDFISGQLSDVLYAVQAYLFTLFGLNILSELLLGGILEGLIAGIAVALPYIAPFYFILYLLEDSGYLSRIAFLMDNAMHTIGLHGKAFIPLLLGYGCNVPACLGCRILETQRERLLAGFVSTLIPCAARTVMILGLVGVYLGIEWALAIYAINLLVVFILGRIAFKVLPGEPTALIMELSEYRVPHFKTAATQAWFRLEEFIKVAFPLIIAGSFAIKFLDIFQILGFLIDVLSPITVLWLGLPAVTGITLIFGVLRKELTLVMLATLLGTTNFSTVLSPTQMIVFTLVTLFYIPCISTISALVHEYGWKKAIYVTLFEVGFAILLGGVAYRIL